MLFYLRKSVTTPMNRDFASLSITGRHDLKKVKPQRKAGRKALGVRLPMFIGTDSNLVPLNLLTLDAASLQLADQMGSFGNFTPLNQKARFDLRAFEMQAGTLFATGGIAAVAGF